MKKATKHRLKKVGSTVRSSASRKPTRTTGSKDCLENSVAIERLGLDLVDSSFHRQKLETAIKQNWVICCLLCNKVFQSNRALEVHMKHHTGDKPFKLKKPERTPERKAVLKNHLMGSHVKKTHIKAYCSKCDKWFYDKWTLQRHTNVHTGEKRVKCSVKGCITTFSNPASVKRHQSRVHGINNSLFSAVQSLNANNENLVGNVNSLERKKDNFLRHVKKDTSTNCTQTVSRDDVECSVIQDKGDLNDKSCLNNKKVLLRSSVKKKLTCNPKKAVDTGKVKSSVFKKCPKCDKTLANNCKCSCRTTLQPYSCDEDGCEAAYTFRSSLLNHKRGVHGKDAVPQKASREKKTPSSKRVCTPTATKRSHFCIKFKKTVFGNRKFETHRYSLTKRRLYTCNEEGCSAVYTRKTNMTHHKMTVHGDNLSSVSEMPGRGSKRQLYKCNEDGCSGAYTSKSNLFRHKKNHHSENLNFESEMPESGSKRQLYKCSEDGCSGAYSSKSNLVRHKKTSHSENLNEESEMPKRTSQVPKDKLLKCIPTQPAVSLENLFRHKKTVSAQNCELAFKCRKEGCQAAFMYKKRLLRHVVNVHGESVESTLCVESEEASDNSANEGMENGKIAACIYEKGMDKDVHGKNFDFTLNPETEMPEKAGRTLADKPANCTLDRNANPKKSYFCAECNMIFFRKPVFERHIYLHEKMLLFRCRECPAVYTCEKWLTRHVRNIHDKTSDTALEAKSTTLQKAVHKGADVSVPSKLVVDPYAERTNFCTICNKTFSSKERYERHANLHIKKTLFRCNKTGCEASYAHIRWLVLHNEKVHGEKLESSLSAKNCVSRHALDKVQDLSQATNIFSHGHTQKYLCTKCNLLFVDKRKFERHNNLHTKMQIYKCNEKGCLAMYTCEKWLMRHTEKVHVDRLEAILTPESGTSQKAVHKNKAVGLSKQTLDTNNNPQKSEICSKGSKTTFGKSNFQMHSTLCTNSLYKCSEDRCGAVFAHRQSLSRHQVKVHCEAVQSSITISPSKKKIAPSRMKTLHVYDFDSFESPAKKENEGFINCNLKGVHKNEKHMRLNKESACKRKRLPSRSRERPVTKRKKVVCSENGKPHAVGKRVGLKCKNSVHFAALKRLSSRKNVGLSSSLSKGTLVNQRITVRKEKFGSFSFVKRGKFINHRKNCPNKSVGCSSNERKRTIASRKKVTRSKAVGSNSNSAKQRDENHKEPVCIEDGQLFSTENNETSNVKEVVIDSKDVCTIGTVTSVSSAAKGTTENNKAVDSEIADSPSVITQNSMTKNATHSSNELFSGSASNVSQELQSHKEDVVENVKSLVEVAEDTLANHEIHTEPLLIESIVTLSDHNAVVITESVSNESTSTLLVAGDIVNANFSSDIPEETSAASVCCENSESLVVDNILTGASYVQIESVEKDESILSTAVPNDEEVCREHGQIPCSALDEEIAKRKGTGNKNNDDFSSDVNKESILEPKKLIRSIKLNSLSDKSRWTLRSTILKSRGTIRSKRVVVSSNVKKRTIRNKSSQHDKKAASPLQVDKKTVENCKNHARSSNLDSVCSAQKIKLRSQKKADFTETRVTSENAVEETNTTKRRNNAKSPSSLHEKIVDTGQNVVSLKLISSRNNTAQRFKCTEEGCIVTYSHEKSLIRHQKAIHSQKFQTPLIGDDLSANRDTGPEAVDLLRKLLTPVNDVKETFDKKTVDSESPATEDRPYKCREEGCNARYRSKTSLYRHRRFAHFNGKIRGNPSASKTTVKDPQTTLRLETFETTLAEVDKIVKTQKVDHKGQQEENSGLNRELATKRRKIVRTVFSSLNRKKVACSENGELSSSASSSATVTKAAKSVKSEIRSDVKNGIFLDSKKIGFNESVASPSSLASSAPEFTSTPIPCKIKSYQNNHNVLAFSPSLQKSIRHTSIKPYKCQEADCGATFASVGSMWNHKIAFHDRTTPLKVIINSSA